MSMKFVRAALFGLLTCVFVGCGSSNDPQIPENPTAGPPGGGPTTEGLPGSEAPREIPEESESTETDSAE